MIGGRIGAAFITSGSNTDVVEGYDPATDTWTPPRERMPTPRSAITLGVYKDQIIVAGGEFQDRRMLGAFRAVEAYDPAVNRWSHPAVDAQPAPWARRRRHRRALLRGERRRAIGRAAAVTDTVRSGASSTPGRTRPSAAFGAKPDCG